MFKRKPVDNNSDTFKIASRAKTNVVTVRGSISASSDTERDLRGQQVKQMNIK
jgi:hypothetical protein